MSEQPPAHDVPAELSKDEDLSALEQQFNQVSQQTDKTEPIEPQEPPSEWEVLRAQLADKPHDPDGWRKLVEIAENSGDLSKITQAYDSLLAAYPNTVRAYRLPSLNP